ncbi:MAG: carboxypeptidase regulatory-like domain-containing protein, partial [Saprospiraceae bacterium]|nr:carboxypeptidase regulatory-like domain-containing protein [Saprospiraceae bacterium]
MMKSLTLLCSLFGLVWMAANPIVYNTTSTGFKGQVSDHEGHKLAGVQVRALTPQGKEFTATTDTSGQFNLNCADDVATLEFSKNGFATFRYVSVKATGIQTLNVRLTPATLPDELVVATFSTGIQNGAAGAPLTASDVLSLVSTGSVAVRSADKAATPPAPATKPSDAIRDAGAPVHYEPEKPMPVESSGAMDEVIVAPATYKESRKHYDEVPKDRRKKSDADATAFKVELAGETKVPIDYDGPTPAPKTQPTPKAGLLTAGEWSDLNNWNTHWTSLLADGEIKDYQKMYDFHPRHRYTLILENDQQVPVADAIVQLLSADGNLLWRTRTDNTGKAELWANLFDGSAAAPSKVKAEVWYKDTKFEIGQLQPAEKGVNLHQLHVPCEAPKNVEIVWVVDATGSMGDEIEYLKTELLDVIGRAKSRNTELSYRMGTVFYRDNGDEYLTKSSGLSDDINRTVDFIRHQSAGGGGDYPEAVHSALESAIYDQKWSTQALARICFLVLDASPHQAPEVNASLQKSIREAATRGIRIVPIAASGVQKDTEFLMKFFGLATNGSYVFLTDHSGIGGKHLEPTTDEYKVELLNDLLVRLIAE